MADTWIINGKEYSVTPEQRAVVERLVAEFRANLKSIPDYPSNSIGCHPDPNEKGLRELRARVASFFENGLESS